MSLDRQAQCPSCGAPIAFRFGGARTQVCDYCRAVVARTDRGLESQGRMADLLELPTPLQVGIGGWWGQRRFEVIGRVQMDRAGAPGAPWQEILLAFADDGSTTWVAFAQGNWYATNEVPPSGPVPYFESLAPGQYIDLGYYGHWVVQEIGQRRVVSGEGSLTGVPRPGVVTRYADISGPEGRFGTIDYGDGSAPPVLFVGRQFNPAELYLDTGMPLEQPQAQVQSLECPNCGAALPILSQQSERVVCQYCGMASDITQGSLQALGPQPKPPIVPVLPIGAQGVIKGIPLIVCGFVIRATIVEGTVYSWREYLLWGGDSVGYRWLMEEDNQWQLITPIPAGDVVDSGSSVMHEGEIYDFKQQVRATVDYVIGEFYWKIEVGETVEATEFVDELRKLNRERSATEVVFSLGEPLDPKELASFGITPPAGAVAAGKETGCGQWLMWSIIIGLALIVFAIDECGGGVGGGFVGGGYYGGK